MGVGGERGLGSKGMRKWESGSLGKVGQWVSGRGGSGGVRACAIARMGECQVPEWESASGGECESAKVKEREEWKCWRVGEWGNAIVGLEWGTVPGWDGGRLPGCQWERVTGRCRSMGVYENACQGRMGGQEGGGGGE